MDICLERFFYILRETLLTWPLRERWFWMLFILFVAMAILPLLLIGVILYLSPSSLFLTLLVAVALWFIFRSYKDWVEREDKEREKGEVEQFKLLVTVLNVKCMVNFDCPWLIISSK